MKIAIVAPSPVPFTIGGVENLLWGLCNWMNQNTEHQVELIKLPSRELDFWSLIETYRNFYNLDLNYFDMVISTKYPAWMVRHNNHVCYLQHRLRGLYDTCHVTQKTKRGCKKVDFILDYMANNPEVDSLDKFFDMLYDLKKNHAGVPAEYFDFPAPFIRDIIHYLDNNALTNHRIKKFLCISETVKNRKEYFPPNSQVVAVHHPSNLKNYTFGEYKHIFMVSRLDDPKRIDLLIQAMRYVKADIKLYIAGTGPAEEQLKAMAAGDNRIVFLGFVKDAEVEQYYKDSIVVPYFPYYEDYGLITIEAMMHKKPVITTVDSGGPTEFVKNMETGFVVRPDPKEIAEKIDYFASDPTEAERMGQNAYALAKKITWQNVVDAMLSQGPVDSYGAKTTGRKKITVTSTFPIYPPLTGGQVRIFNLYKNLSQVYDVEIVSIADERNNTWRKELSPGFVENRTSKSERHCNKDRKIQNEVGIPVADAAMQLLIQYTPEYIEKLRNAIEESEWTILSHPYMWPAAKSMLQNKRFIYEAHNVEYNLKKKLYPENNKTAMKLLNIVFEIEKECCEKSEFIMACSDEDKLELTKLYNIPEEKCIVVPNGVDTSKTKFVGMEERLQRKQRAEISGEKIGLFMGSWHGPNVEACDQVFEIAKKCPEVKFLIMGNLCSYYADKPIPENVGLLGLVSDEIKNRVFGLVDFALNPMLSGSGTNLKMFDYMAAGIPIITTEFGARGIESKDIFIMSDIEQMAEVIDKFELGRERKLIFNSYNYVKKHFDWSVIVKRLLSKMQGSNLQSIE